MRLLAITLVLLAPEVAGAQPRTIDPVSGLSDGTLGSLVSAQQSTVERCARRGDTGAYVADVQASVRPGARPSTLYNARISVSVRSRPRDGDFESCVRRGIVDGLRHQPYAVDDSVRARQTFRIAERPDPPAERPAVPYSANEVSRVLDSSSRGFQQCLEMAGVPETVTLRVAVEPSGRLVLTNANVPAGASRHALGCLTRAVSRLEVQGRPSRRVNVTHSVGVRNRAW